MLPSDTDLTSFQGVIPEEGLNRLTKWLKDQEEDSRTWLNRIHNAMMIFAEKKSARLDDLRISQGGASTALAGLLKHLGDRNDLKPHLDKIQDVSRFYLAILGFRGADRVFVNQLPQQKETLNSPGTIDLEFKLAVDLLEAFRRLLDDHLQLTLLSEHERLGLLIISLVLRDGALSLSEITMALKEISAGRIICHKCLYYVVGPVTNNGIHRRRLHFSAISVALGVHVPQLLITPTLLNASLEAARKRLNTPAGKHGLKLRTLISAAQHYLRMADCIPQFVIDYAQQLIHSDSLEEACFARLLGVTPNAKAIANEQALKYQDSRSKIPDTQYQPSGAIRKISLACTVDKNRDKAKKVALDIAREYLENGNISATERLVIEWACWMIDVRKLAPSTSSGHMVTLYRPLQASLLKLDMSLVEQTPDQWDALVEDMTRSLNRRNNLFDAVVEMTTFLNYKTHGNFKNSGYSDPALVNAYVISDIEKNEALKLLEVKLGRSDPELAKQAQYALEFAHHLGNRRWEYLGLTFQDVIGKKDPILKIQNNSIRWLKTDASNRTIPLSLVSHSPLYDSWRKQADAPGSLDPWESILEACGFNVAKNERRMFDAINDVLYQVTASNEVTYHTLRHTAVCRMMLSLYWDELRLDELTQFDYFREISEAAPRIREVLLRRHTQHFSEHKTVSSIVGHLSFSTTAGHYFHFMDLIRWAFLRQINSSSILPDKATWVAALGNIPAEKSISINKTLNKLGKQHPNHFLRHIKRAPKRLDFSGLGLREKLDLIGEVVVKAPEDWDRHLSKLIPDDSRRANYLIGLTARIEYIQNMLKKKKQWNTKNGGILVKPTERTVQIEILEIMNRASKAHDTNDKLRQLSAGLLLALTHLKPSNPGTFRFKNVKDAQNILEPVTILLDMARTEIDCWYYISERGYGKHEKKIKKRKRVKTLAELPFNDQGVLLVRFSFGATTKTTPQRALIWAMSSIYCTYGYLTTKN